MGFGVVHVCTFGLVVVFQMVVGRVVVGLVTVVVVDLGLVVVDLGLVVVLGLDVVDGFDAVGREKVGNDMSNSDNSSTVTSTQIYNTLY